MIRIFSDTFDFITEIDAVGSVMWTKRWHKQGEFQIVVNQHMEHVDELLEGRIVSVGSNKTGIIAHIEEMTSENGKGDDQLIVRGYDLKGILAKRFTIPPDGQAYDGQTADAETLMKQFVNNNAVLTTSERIISDLTVAPNLNRGSSFFYQTRFKNLKDELEKLSITSGLGWEVQFDGSSYLFDVSEGRNLTSTQNIHPPVIFSVEFDNVRSQKVIESSLDYKNVAIVAGQGEGAAREIAFIGTASGLARNEIFIDARDIAEDGNLQDRGQQKLDEYAKVESFETSVLPYGPFEYGRDWQLGDIVTVQNAKKTKTAQLRVTEIVEIIEKDGYQLDATFGQPLPTIIEKIKRETDNPIAEGGGEGVAGVDGTDGAGLDFIWQGTSLGIKRDEETAYQYTDLKGDQGVQGIQGETGPQGLSGEVQTYNHNQISASTVWVINHNLNKFPHVAVIDSAGSVVHGDVDHIDTNTLEVRFTSAFSGKANII
ncbi:siphovirus ReqiPepy6 Gp37-like family protein [Paenisporosarcina macmurdoensis]|uniref:Siphovirus ReqiPepy6 Gp37-like family protein n=1 Tax=Paenisporosarcina macmurdoensis TaxID=212659 RepID=A0ABW1L422_9BACL